MVWLRRVERAAPYPPPRTMAAADAKAGEQDLTPSSLSWVLRAQALGLGLAAVAATAQAVAAVWVGGLALGAPLPFLLALRSASDRRGLGVLTALLNVGVGAVLVDALDVRKRRPSLALLLLCLAYALASLWLARRAAQRQRR